MPASPIQSPAPPPRRAPARARGFTFFTNRERQILRLLVAGRTVGAIAAELGLARSTVTTFRAAVRTKLGCVDSTALTKWLRLAAAGDRGRPSLNGGVSS